MHALNRADLIGNLGKDPELTFGQSGTARCRFSLATNEKWQDGDGKPREHTEWHSIVVWGAHAEACGKYLTKGSKVFVSGRIRTRSYDDKDGNKKSITEIQAQSVIFLDARGAASSTGSVSHRGNDDSAGAERSTASAAENNNMPSDDEIPF